MAATLTPAALAANSASSAVDSHAALPAAAKASAGEGVSQPCWLPGLAHAARCGVLRRALDPARPLGPQIELHFAVLPALARHKADDAVFFFAGGPGQSAVDLAAVLAARYARLNQRRDLVFVDQRGTGRSAPLKCADDDERAVLRPLAEQVDDALRLRQLSRCRLTLQARPHGDLRFYTTVLATADADAVRQALGITRINAIGASYGTRAVLDYQRQYPLHVRRAVLDGVAPPDMRLPDAASADNQAALDALFDACAAQPACAQRYPALRAQWLALLAGLPRQVVLPHPVTGRPETVTLQRDGVLALVRASLYVPMLVAALPAAITEATAGRWAPLAALAGALGGGKTGVLASGLHFSVVCAEDMGPQAPLPVAPVAAPAATSSARAALPAASTVFGASLASLYQQVCADWPRGEVPAAFYTLPRAATPTWLLSGGLDPVTPPRHGERVARALGPLARHIVVANVGHGVAGLACMREAISRFITTDDDAAALAVDASCADAMPRALAFMPPGAGLATPPAQPASGAPAAPAVGPATKAH